jgi:TP901 family phage tail tape measure protein
VSRLGEAFVEIVGDASRLEGDVAGALGGLEGEAQAAGSKVEAALTGTVAKGAAAAGAAAAGALAVGINQAIGLDAQLRETVTLFGETGAAAEASVDSLKGPVQDLSRQFGIATDELTGGLYNAISAGVPRDNAFVFLEEASKFAVAGVTDVETAVDGLTTAINAYGLDAADTEQVADAFFAAIQGGKTNAEELSKSLFNVAPAASAAGISLEETLASVAALTASGTPTSVATTQMRAAINELADSGSNVGGIFEDLAGQSFRDFTASGGTVAEALEMIGDKALDSGDVIGDYFGSVEAAAAATTLYNDSSGAFAANLELQADAAGKTADAFGVVSEGAAFQLDVLKQEGLALLTTLGNQFLPVVQDVLGVVREWVERFQNLSPEMQQMIGRAIAFTAVLGPIPLLVGKMIAPFGKLVGAIGGVVRVLNVLRLAILANPLLLIIAAVVAVIAIIWHFRDEIMAALGAAWDWIRNTAGAVWDWLSEKIEAVAEWIIGVWDGFVGWLSAIWDRITSGAREFVDRFVQGWDQLVAGVQAAWDTIVAGVQAAVDWIVGLFDRLREAWDAVTLWIRTAASALVDGWQGFAGEWSAASDGIFALFARIGETVRAFVDAVVAGVTWLAEQWWEGVQAIWGAITWVAETIAGWVETVVGFVTDLWSRWQALAWAIRDAVIGAVVALVETVVATVSGWVASIVGLVTGLKDRWVNLVRDIRDRVVEFVARLISTVVRLVTGWVADIKRFVTNLKTDFVGTIRTLASDVLDRFRRLPGDILSALGNLGSLLLQAGKDLVGGLISGVTGMAGQAASAVGEVARGMVGRVTGIFRNQSPSRLFAEIGEDVVDGLALGVRDQMAVAIRQAEALANGVAEAGTPPPMFHEPPADLRAAMRPTSLTPAQVAAAVTAASGPQGHAGSVVQHVYTADPRRAANESVRRLRDVGQLGRPFDIPRGAPTREVDRARP